MSDTYKRRPEASGSTTVKGARAGESFATDEDLERKASADEYDKQQGISGIAGQAKRAKPEYKKGLEAFRAERKKKRQGITAMDAGNALAKSTEEK